MKTYSYITGIIFFLIVTTFSAIAQEEENGGMADMFVHPFLAHMALPDKPGEVSLRVTPFQDRIGSDVEQDLALHIEAGLLPNLGLHVRSDGIKNSPYSEVMLMYSFLHDAGLHNGMSIFGQVGLPTGPANSGALKYLFGVSGRVTIPKFMVMDANTHINLADKMAEYESSFVFKASKLLYPEVELRGEITQQATSLYSLLGLKFRIADETAFGVGIQTPITHEREYDTEALFTLGMAF
ncbi:MAG: hypothetical protein PQJ28_01055 [Spirochaetales bacterium]|nr:hypothetical protein [Spirochaetales bacterium]